MTSSHAPRTTARQRWWVRCLLAVMLLAALAPTLSRAMAAQHQGNGWVELCTSAGTRWVQVSHDVEANEDTSGSGDTHPLDACGYCVLANERFAPLLPALPAVLAHAPADGQPVFAAVQTPLPDVPRHAARDPPF